MGKNLVETVLEGTGLPDTMIRNEFDRILDRHGLNSETMTLDDLRKVVADYLQDVFLEIKKGS